MDGRFTPWENVYEADTKEQGWLVIHMSMVMRVKVMRMGMSMVCRRVKQ